MFVAHICLGTYTEFGYRETQKPRETPLVGCSLQLLAGAGQLGTHIALPVCIDELSGSKALILGSVILDGNLHISGLASSVGRAGRHIGKEAWVRVERKVWW